MQRNLAETARGNFPPTRKRSDLHCLGLRLFVETNFKAFPCVQEMHSPVLVHVVLLAEVAITASRFDVESSVDRSGTASVGRNPEAARTHGSASVFKNPFALSSEACWTKKQGLPTHSHWQAQNYCKQPEVQTGVSWRSMVSSWAVAPRSARRQQLRKLRTQASLARLESGASESKARPRLGQISSAVSRRLRSTAQSEKRRVLSQVWFSLWKVSSSRWTSLVRAYMYSEGVPAEYACPRLDQVAWQWTRGDNQSVRPFRDRRWSPGLDEGWTTRAACEFRFRLARWPHHRTANRVQASRVAAARQTSFAIGWQTVKVVRRPWRVAFRTCQ